MVHLILNALVFDLGWLLTIVTAAQGLVWIGPLFSLCWLGVHLYWHPSTRYADLWLCLGAAVFGYIADSVLVLTGMLSFPVRTQFGSPSTLWMVTLWVNLALTLNHSLVWLQHRYLIAAVLGALFAPLTYLAGSKLGAITLDGGMLSLSVIGTLWFVSMPMLVWMAVLVNRRDNTRHYRVAIL